MKTAMPANSYKNHRVPAEIISHAVWRYFRFCLSDRDVEELLFARGVTVTYEAMRKWCRTFGQASANQLCRRHPQPGDTWHMDEVFLTIQKKRYYWSRAVDQDGPGLDILGQRWRDKQAAKKLFRKLLKGLTYVPLSRACPAVPRGVWSHHATFPPATTSRVRPSRPPRDAATSPYLAGNYEPSDLRIERTTQAVMRLPTS